MLNLKANIWDDEGLSLLLTCLLHFFSLAYFLLLSKLYKQHNNINYRDFYSGIGPFLGPQKDVFTCFYVSASSHISTRVCHHTHLWTCSFWAYLHKLFGTCWQYFFLPKVFLVLHATVGVSNASKHAQTHMHTHTHTRQKMIPVTIYASMNSLQIVSECFIRFFSFVTMCISDSIGIHMILCLLGCVWMCMSQAVLGEGRI